MGSYIMAAKLLLFFAIIGAYPAKGMFWAPPSPCGPGLGSLANKQSGDSDSPQEVKRIIDKANELGKGIKGFQGGDIWFGKLVYFIDRYLSKGYHELIERLKSADVELKPESDLYIYGTELTGDDLRFEFCRVYFIGKQGYAGFRFSEKDGFTVYYDVNFRTPDPPTRYGKYPLKVEWVSKTAAERYRKTM